MDNLSEIQIDEPVNAYQDLTLRNEFEEAVRLRADNGFIAENKSKTPDLPLPKV